MPFFSKTNLGTKLTRIPFIQQAIEISRSDQKCQKSTWAISLTELSPKGWMLKKYLSFHTCSFDIVKLCKTDERGKSHKWEWHNWPWFLCIVRVSKSRDQILESKTGDLNAVWRDFLYTIRLSISIARTREKLQNAFLEGTLPKMPECSHFFLPLSKEQGSTTLERFPNCMDQPR